MKFISTRMHGVLDYVVGGALLLAPELFRLRDVPPSALTPRVQGAAALSYSLITDYELSLVKLLPMPAHLALDVLGGVMLGASPWVLGYKDKGVRYWLPHVLVAATEIAVPIFTRTRPAYKL